MERSFTVTYRWWREGRKEIKPDHVGTLEEAAMARINEMTGQGYLSGELCETVRTDDSDGPDGIEYTGWWEVKYHDPNGGGTRSIP